MGVDGDSRRIGEPCVSKSRCEEAVLQVSPEAVAEGGFEAVSDALFEVYEGAVEVLDGDEGAEVVVEEFGGFDGVGEKIWRWAGLVLCVSDGQGRGFG